MSSSSFYKVSAAVLFTVVADGVSGLESDGLLLSVKGKIFDMALDQ